MARLLFLLNFLICLSVSAEEYVLHENVVQCSLYPDIQMITYYFSRTDIKHPEKMRRVIPALMRLDLSTKIEALSLALPEDWNDEDEGIPYEVRLSAYNRSFFSRQATCLVENYKSGDKLYRFEQPPEDSHDEGYALFRNDSLIAIVITGGVKY